MAGQTLAMSICCWDWDLTCNLCIWTWLPHTEHYVYIIAAKADKYSELTHARGCHENSRHYYLHNGFCSSSCRLPNALTVLRKHWNAIRQFSATTVTTSLPLSDGELQPGLNSARSRRIPDPLPLFADLAPKVWNPKPCNWDLTGTISWKFIN